MTARATVPPTEKQINVDVTRTAISDVTTAWDAAPQAIRLLTISAVLAALSSSVSSAVPVASGLAIAILVPAALVDWHQRRLPDAIVFVAAITFALAAIAANVLGAGISPAGTGLGLAVFVGPLLMLHLVSPKSMGFGDVKAGAVLGMAVGAVAWGLAPWAMTAAAAATALAGIIRRRSALPFGPGLVAGALAAVVATATLGLDRIGFG